MDFTRLEIFHFRLRLENVADQIRAKLWALLRSLSEKGEIEKLIVRRGRAGTGIIAEQAITSLRLYFQTETDQRSVKPRKVFIAIVTYNEEIWQVFADETSMYVIEARKQSERPWKELQKYSVQWYSQDWKTLDTISSSDSRMRNAFYGICLLADEQKWCWKLQCTTCGHMEFLYAFYQVGLDLNPSDGEWINNRQESQGRHVQYDLDFVKLDEKNRESVKAELSRMQLMSIPELREGIRHSVTLYERLADADILAIAKSCKFPDYLGYIGLALYYLKSIEMEDGVLSRRWGEQLS